MGSRTLILFIFSQRNTINRDNLVHVVYYTYYSLIFSTTLQYIQTKNEQFIYYIFYVHFQKMFYFVEFVVHFTEFCTEKCWFKKILKTTNFRGLAIVAAPLLGIKQLKLFIYKTT